MWIAPYLVGRMLLLAYRSLPQTGTMEWRKPQTYHTRDVLAICLMEPAHVTVESEGLC